MDVDLSSFVTQYSVAKHGNMYVAPHFQLREFRCRDGSDPVFLNILIPFICEAVRTWCGTPFSPTSAYRTVSYNSRSDVGGAARSNHIYGNAVDIPAVGGKTPRELYAFLELIVGDTCELILYPWGCHLGIQNEKKRLIAST